MPTEMTAVPSARQRDRETRLRSGLGEAPSGNISADTQPQRGQGDVDAHDGATTMAAIDVTAALMNNEEPSCRQRR